MACISLNRETAGDSDHAKTSFTFFVPMTIAVAAAGPPSPVHADESSKPDHAMLLASNAPGMQHGVGFGIVTVSAPQPLPAGRTSVTLWDEIPAAPVADAAPDTAAG